MFDAYHFVPSGKTKDVFRQLSSTGPEMSNTSLSPEASEFVPSFANSACENKNYANTSEVFSRVAASSPSNNPVSTSSVTTTLTADAAPFQPDFVQKAAAFRLAGMSVALPRTTTSPYVSVGTSLTTIPLPTVLPPRVIPAFSNSLLVPSVPMNLPPQFPHMATPPPVAAPLHLRAVPIAPPVVQAMMAPRPIGVSPVSITPPAAVRPTAAIAILPPSSSPPQMPPPVVPTDQARTEVSNGGSVQDDIVKWKNSSESFFTKIEKLQTENEKLRTELSQKKDLTTRQSTDYNLQSALLWNEKAKTKNLSEALASAMIEGNKGRGEKDLLKSENQELKMALASLNEDYQDLKKDYKTVKAEKEEIERMVDNFEKQFNDVLRIKERWKKRMKILEDRLFD